MRGCTTHSVSMRSITSISTTSQSVPISAPVPVPESELTERSPSIATAANPEVHLVTTVMKVRTVLHVRMVSSLRLNNF